MRNILFLTLFLMAPATNAMLPPIEPNPSLKLSVTDDGKPPTGWLKDYQPDHEATIPVHASFNLEWPYVIIIYDEYARNGYCGEQQRTRLAYLVLDPKIKSNMKEFTTRISLPCIHKNKAALTLYISTARDKRYEWTTTFQVYPGLEKATQTKKE